MDQGRRALVQAGPVNENGASVPSLTGAVCDALVNQEPGP